MPTKRSYAALGARNKSNPYWRANCAWVAMRQRCSNITNADYARYGGRGIKVDAHWNDFQKFVSDMGVPQPEQSLDRIDNDGPYSKENCRWATRGQQSRNRSNNRLLTYKGETKTMAEWSRVLGITDNVLLARIKRGWTVEEALSTVGNAKPIYEAGLSAGILSMSC